MLVFIDTVKSILIMVVGSGWFTTDPFEITDKFGGQWKTTDYRAGDVLIFGMKYKIQMIDLFYSVLQL